MKVLIIGSDRKLFQDGSAVARRTIEYGKKIEELHIVVFALKSAGLKEKKISDNVFIHPTNSFSRWFFVLDAISLGKKIVRKNNFVRGLSIVSSQDPFEAGFVGYRIARHFKLPLHLQIHTDFLSPFFASTLLQKIRVATARFLLPRADGIRVVSQRIIDAIQKSGIRLKTKPDILPIQVDLSALDKKTSDADLKKMFPQFKFIIFMASRLTKEKRIADALTAFSYARRSYTFAGLVIAGDGPERKFLEEKVKALGLQKSVIFLGQRDDILTLMSTANMFLSTSEYEGYGMSLVEAGRARCPVLTTNVGITHDILVHRVNAYVCPVGDIECIRKYIVEMIGNNAARYTMAEALYNTLSSHILPQAEYVEKYIENLKKLLPNIKPFSA